MLLSVPKEEPKVEPIEEMELYSEGQYVTTEVMNKIPRKVNEVIRNLEAKGWPVRK